MTTSAWAVPAVSIPTDLETRRPTGLVARMPTVMPTTKRSTPQAEEVVPAVVAAAVVAEVAAADLAAAGEVAAAGVARRPIAICSSATGSIADAAGSFPATFPTPSETRFSTRGLIPSPHQLP